MRCLAVKESAGLMGFPSNGYWGQVDIWFGKDLPLMTRTRIRMVSGSSWQRSR